MGIKRTFMNGAFRRRGGRRGGGDRGIGGNLSVPQQVGAAVHWDPTRGLTEDVGVSAWVDRISGYVLSSSVGSEQPVLEDSTRLGHQSLRFDGSNDFLENTSDAGLRAIFDSGAEHSQYVEAVFGIGSLGNPSVLTSASIAANPTDYSRLYKQNNREYRYQVRDPGANEIAEELTARFEAASWVHGRRDATNAYVEATSVPSDLQAASASSTYDTFTVGASHESSVRQFEHDGEIGHIVLFSSAVAAGIRATMEAWMEGLWAGVEVPFRLGGIEWLDPAYGITLNGSDVSAHVGKIGGLSLAQGTGAAQPEYLATGGPHGTPSLEYESAQKYLQVTMSADVAAIFDAQVGTFYSGYKPTSITTSTTIWGATDISTASVRTYPFLTASDPRMASSDGTTTATTTIATTLSVGTDYWMAVEINGTSARELRHVGETTATNATVITLPGGFDTLTIGARENSGGVGADYKGEQYDHVLFAYTLPDDDITTMDAWADERIAA